MLPVLPGADIPEHLQKAIVGRFHRLVAVAGIAQAHAQGKAVELPVQPPLRHPLLPAAGGQQLGKPNRRRIRRRKVHHRRTGKRTTSAYHSEDTIKRVASNCRFNRIVCPAALTD